MGLTVKQVKAAYEKTKLDPVTDTFFKYGHKGQLVGACPMGAVAVAEQGINPLELDDPEMQIPALLGLSYEYGNGFASAYDDPDWYSNWETTASKDAKRIRKHIPPTNATDE